MEQIVNSETDDVENIKTGAEARQIIIDDPEIREEVVGYIDHLF